MKRILCQSRNPIVHESFLNNDVDVKATGGNAYNCGIPRVLSGKYSVQVDDKSIIQPEEAMLNYWRRMARNEVDADIVIKDPFSVVFGKTNKSAYSVGMIHHLDHKLKSSNLKQYFFFKSLERRLRKLDMVVTVSQYWKGALEQLGCRNVAVIYNSFDTLQYEISEQRVNAFLSKHDLSTDRPIIYIGNASREKGVYDVYESLKDEGYTLVMSGMRNHAEDLPVYFCNFDYEEYLCLLSVCDVVVTMSQMVEGWNRVAHEAMLCKTPVVGSGTGGMEELLIGGRQLVVKDRRKIKEAVNIAMEKHDELAESGYAFASRFNLEYFKREWNGLF